MLKEVFIINYKRGPVSTRTLPSAQRIPFYFVSGAPPCADPALITTWDYNCATTLVDWELTAGNVRQTHARSARQLCQIVTHVQSLLILINYSMPML